MLLRDSIAADRRRIFRLLSSSGVTGQGSPGCEDAAELAVLPSPIAPWKGAPLRVIFAAEKPLEGELSLIAPDGSVAAKSRERQGGPPYFWFAEVASPAAGTWRATLARDSAPAECSTITREIAVRADAPPRPGTTAGSVWPLRNTWNRETENLYSAWIEKLFDAPLDATLSWPALHEVLRDRSRNFLFNHLGLGEDTDEDGHSPRLRRPSLFPARVFRVQDGAAVRLLEVHARRRRQAAAVPAWWNIQNLEPPRPAPPEQTTAPAPSGHVRPPGDSPAGAPRPLAAAPPASAPRRSRWLAPAFGRLFAPAIADGVHSGSGERRLNDDNTDYYPVPLTEETLRPGTLYADPYGHLLVLVRRVSQIGRRGGRLPRR